VIATSSEEPGGRFLATDAGAISAVILAGGQGSRMGGVDKGLQLLDGMPLALHALVRLQQQAPLVGPIMINANRNLGAYEGFGLPVWPDTVGHYEGPLAGFLTGLERCETPYLLTVPCDSPRFPLDLAARLAQALVRDGACIAMAATVEDGRPVPQPVFCLLRVELLESLASFISGGGRKIGAWTAGHRCAVVCFDRPDDDPLAFANANTRAELQSLERVRTTPTAGG
jgi:molybdopterin-guanine dinucleotide biosynthesis protein A